MTFRSTLSARVTCDAHRTDACTGERVWRTRVAGPVVLGRGWAGQELGDRLRRAGWVSLGDAVPLRMACPACARASGWGTDRPG